MHYLSEDPWPLVAILGFVALGFVIALKVTQEGKYLIRAGIALGLAALGLVVEGMWVTDSERIEAVVYDVARAVRASDAEGVVKHLAPEVDVAQGDNDLGSLDVGLIRHVVAQTHFQFLTVDKLTAKAYPVSRRGKATFRTLAQGESQGMAFQPLPATWDLGFREERPGVWKITRISPTSLPGPASAVLRGAMRLQRQRASGL